MTDSTPGATTGWRISSYCTSNGSCVDVWFGDHIVSVRHSQATDGPELSYTHPEWAAFTAAVNDTGTVPATGRGSDGFEPCEDCCDHPAFHYGQCLNCGHDATADPLFSDNEPSGGETT
ncbi:MAG: DUF397 domain-containing protein [Actinomycetia bacterium]|nr:DUF397 domain-containing protein [Actinomycetes bacterium]